MSFNSAKAFSDAFLAEVEEEVAKKGIPSSEWRAGGRVSKAFPNKEDGTWWAAHGPEMVDSWIAWRESLPHWHIWTTPSGEPGIELELRPVILGVPVRMFIDRVFVNVETGALKILDLKTGSRDPDSDLQLGFYKVGLEMTFDVVADEGFYWMARKGQVVPGVDLTRYDENLIGSMLQLFNKAVEQEIFIPHITSSCKTCGVRQACYAMNGAEAHLYDPLHPYYTPDIKRAPEENA